jgi:WD40 repeat protein
MKNKKHFILYLLVSLNLFSQNYSCFDTNFELAKKLYKQKKYSNANNYFYKAINNCKDIRNETDIKDWYIKSLNFALLDKSAQKNNVLVDLKKQNSSSLLSIYSLLFKDVDPTLALRLAYKANSIEKNDLTSIIMNNIFKENLGGFYSNQFEQDDVMSLKILPGDSLFLSGGMSNEIYLWNIRTNKIEVVFRQDTKEIVKVPDNSTTYGDGGRLIYSIALNEGGDKFLAASDNEVVYWDILKKKFLKKFSFNGSDVEKICFLNDSSFVCKVQKFNSSTIQTYNLKKDTCINIISNSNMGYFDLLCIPNQNNYITTNSDSLCEIWNYFNKDPIFSFKTPTIITKIDYNSESGIIAMGGQNGIVYLYDLINKKIVNQFEIFEGPVTSLSMNSRNIVCALNYDKIFSFNYSGSDLPIEIQKHKVKANNSNVVEMSKKNDFFLSFSNTVGGSHTGLAEAEDHYIRLWHLNKTSLIVKDSIQINKNSNVFLDFKRKISHVNDFHLLNNIISISDLNTGVIIDKIIEKSDVRALYVSPNLKFLSYQLLDSSVKVYDLQSKTIVFEKKLDCYLKSQAINDVKNQLLMIKYGKYDKYEVWSLNSNSCIRYIEHKQIASGASFCKNGEFLMVYGWDYSPNNNINVYETNGYKFVNSFGSANKNSTNAIISSYGNYIVTLEVSKDIMRSNPILILREAKTGNKISTIELDNKYQFYYGQNENILYTISEKNDLLYSWYLSPSLNQSIETGMICDYDDSFFEFENLFSEYKY